jgi:hypothetical protein
LVIVLVVAAGRAFHAAAQTETNLYSFGSNPNDGVDSATSADSGTAADSAPCADSGMNADSGDPACTAGAVLTTITKLANGDILIQFSGGVPGALYDVEESSDHLTWPVAATDPANAMGSFSFEDTATAGVLMRYYRAACAYTVGGTLTGLPAGDTVTLQDNGSDNLTLSTNGTFTFPTALPNGYAYSVTVSGTSGGTPTTCTLTNGSGTISGANVTNVAVQCTSTGCPALTGNFDVDMYNAAVADGTANGGVPAVMLTENGGPFRVTARGLCSIDVCFNDPSCVFATIVGTDSCSSTTLPSGTVALQFGTALECGGGPYGY